MRTRDEIIAGLKDPGLIAVVRTKKSSQVGPLCEALVDGGLTAVEITTTVPDAEGMIREVSQALGERAIVGAGTVLDAERCADLIAAGAEFIVSPIVRTELIQTAHERSKPVMLGAYTPTEAQHAYEAGADFIKIFPADGLGPKYVKALKAPLPHLQIVPTGGVDLTTAVDFLKAGCAALGIGSSLLKAEILESEDWQSLARLATQYIQLIREFRQSS